MANPDIFAVRFLGGPLAGALEAYPCHKGPQIILPTSNDSEVIYDLADCEIAKMHLETTGEHVYSCVFNGLAEKPNIGIACPECGNFIKDDDFNTLEVQKRGYLEDTSGD